MRDPFCVEDEGEDCPDCDGEGPEDCVCRGRGVVSDKYIDWMDNEYRGEER